MPSATGEGAGRAAGTSSHARQAPGLPRHGPFSLDDEDAYRRWRDHKWRRRPVGADALMVELRNPAAPSRAELDALRRRVRDANMALYCSDRSDADTGIARRLGIALGLHRLDRNWLADDDGISLIRVGGAAQGNAGTPQVSLPPTGGGTGAGRPPGRADAAGEGYIPYTDRAIRWHTDGYYHPPERTIRAMILHCVRPAAAGGANRLVDHELAYIALREADPEGVRALMAGDAMTIPVRMEQGEVARAEQPGPVFAVDPHSGVLHMRYTARTRSIAWRDDAATRASADWLLRWLDAADNPCRIAVRLEAGMGMVTNNVLHDREAFADTPGSQRLLFRARYLDRIDVGAHSDAARTA